MLGHTTTNQHSRYQYWNQNRELHTRQLHMFTSKPSSPRVLLQFHWEARIPWRAHCKLLSHIVGTMDPVFFLCMKCIKFIQSASRSDNSVVKTITGIGLCNTHSIMGANARCLYAVYSMDVAEVALSWKILCETESDRICTSVQIRELIELRD